jgi:hypothetical protein
VSFHCKSSYFYTKASTTHNDLSTDFTLLPKKQEEKHKDMGPSALPLKTQKHCCNRNQKLAPWKLPEAGSLQMLGKASSAQGSSENSESALFSHLTS